MFSIYQGETSYINVTVLDETGVAANLNGATAKFVCSKGTEEIKKDCTILNNVVTAKLTPEDTDTMQGKYAFEIKIKDVASDVDTLLFDHINVLKSLLPTY